MNSWLYIAMHTAAAAVFIFLLQRYALNATLESSLVWAVVFGGCAAGLAYSQSNRRSTVSSRRRWAGRRR